MRYLFIFVLLLAFSGSLFSQNEQKVFENIDEALENPSAVYRYYLDCDTEDDTLFWNNCSSFSNMQSLTVVGFAAKSFPVELLTLKKLTTLNITECGNIDFVAFFSSLRSLSQLNQITIDECDILVLPPVVATLPVLNRLIITNCDNFDVGKSVDVLSQCKNLKYLGLPVNQICELPPNIGKLSQIEIIDISNNALYDLPESMSQMSSLNSFVAASNLFINPVDAYSKISSLQIKYLSVDPILSDEDRERLEKLFPQTTIEYVSADQASSDIQQTAPDSVTTYGEFISMDGRLQILSEAYIHYARLFNFSNDFDSLLFDERYADMRYSNTSRNSQAMVYSWDAIDIFFWKAPKDLYPKGTICFNFYAKSGASYNQTVIKSFKELMAFRGMYWILDEDMSKKEFNKTFVNKKNLKKQPGLGWNDFRIFYDDELKSFSLEFKNLNGFVRIKAHPVAENQNQPELSKTDYIKRYTRYQRSLDSRRKRFNTNLTRSKISYRKTYNKLVSNQWKYFSDNYFSDTEKKMSQKQWLDYYDRVIADEKSAFTGASVTENLLGRYLVINNYIQSFSTALLPYDSLPVDALVDFADPIGNKCVVKKIFLINTMLKVFSIAEGTLGFEPHQLEIGKSTDMIVVVFLRNGQVGVADRASYSQLSPVSGGVATIVVRLFGDKLFTFGQLAVEAGL
ncbi:MAG: hypothetical protein CVU11_06840 [Bacteroidetes bacterium HGW-Bacteroidetes-6]|nr:MAG: hypothetical protein CVU11_06840 [Bacteroidetes bacterium HGW-Bacteroidetes-6]